MISPGIYSMTANAYHADPCETPSLSSSIAKILCMQSSLHAFNSHPRLNPSSVRDESEVMDIGSIAHAMLLEGEDIAVEIDVDDWRTKAAREARDAARAAGRVPIKAKDMVAVRSMMQAIRSQLATHSEASNAFTNGQPEQVLIWQEPNGVWCRARLDWLHDDHRYIDDLKTGDASANPEIRSRTLFQYGLDVQAAFYLRGLKSITGADAQFRFVFAENQAPHALSVVSLDPRSLQIAERKVEHAIKLWGECLKSGNWPGYPNRIAYAEVPAWEEVRFMEREAANGISV